jgi:hypothetical protein
MQPFQKWIPANRTLNILGFFRFFRRWDLKINGTPVADKFPRYKAFRFFVRIVPIYFYRSNILATAHWAEGRFGLVRQIK